MMMLLVGRRACYGASRTQVGLHHLRVSALSRLVPVAVAAAVDVVVAAAIVAAAQGARGTRPMVTL